MGQIVTTIFDSLGVVINGIADAIKSAASHLIWQDPTAQEKVLSDFMQFGLVFLGIGLAMGITYGVFRLVRR